MRHLLTILTLLALVSCDRQIKQPTTVDFYYTTSFRGRIDTLAVKQIDRYHNQLDTLIAYHQFKFNGDYHSIKMYSSDLYGPTDSGHLMYELDSLGIIYSRNTTWPQYRRLHSNNDSINLLIDLGLETILLNRNLCCYQPELLFKAIQVTMPEIDETKD